MNNIILAATLIVAFFMCVGSFIWGIKVGKQLGNNQVPNVTINPVKKVIEAVETHQEKKEQEKITDELTGIMGATKESMLQAIKSEVK